MQVTIVESEIKEAIRLYLKNNIGLSEEKKINIDFTATRGNEGLKASIDILNGSDEPVKTPAEVWADQVVEAAMKPKEEEPVQVKEPDGSKKSLFANLTA